jgi:hypothetical protein
VATKNVSQATGCEKNRPNTIFTNKNGRMDGQASRRNCEKLRRVRWTLSSVSGYLILVQIWDDEVEYGILCYDHTLTDEIY